MRRCLLALISLLALAALASPLAGSGAGPRAGSAQVVIKVGDAVAIHGTHVGCYGVTDDRRDGIVCFKVDSKGFTPGTFGVGIAEDGTSTAYKIRENRTPRRIFRRMLQGFQAPAAASAEAKTIVLGVGKVFNLKGTSILCQIVKITTGVAPLYRGVKVGCFRADSAGALPNTYGVAVTDKFAGVFRFKANRDVGADVFVLDPALRPGAGFSSPRVALRREPGWPPPARPPRPRRRGSGPTP